MASSPRPFVDGICELVRGLVVVGRGDLKRLVGFGAKISVCKACKVEVVVVVPNRLKDTCWVLVKGLK